MVLTQLPFSGWDVFLALQELDPLILLLEIKCKRQLINIHNMVMLKCSMSNLSSL